MNDWFFLAFGVGLMRVLEIVNLRKQEYSFIVTIQGCLGIRIPDQIHPSQSRINIEVSKTHRMIVVPQGSRLLAVLVNVNLVIPSPQTVFLFDKFFKLGVFFI